MNISWVIRSAVLMKCQKTFEMFKRQRDVKDHVVLIDHVFKGHEMFKDFEVFKDHEMFKGYEVFRNEVVIKVQGLGSFQ